MPSFACDWGAKLEPKQNIYLRLFKAILLIAVAVTDNILDIGKGVGKMREAGDAGTEEYHEMLLDAVTSSNVAEILP